MLFRSSEIIGHRIVARDGEVGRLTDLLFDETDWTIRWASVHAGTWLGRRRVLVPVSAFEHVDRAGGHLTVALTRRQIEDSPQHRPHEPLSRRREAELLEHYGWDPYWTGRLASMGHMLTGGIPTRGSTGILFPPDLDRRTANDRLPAAAEAAGNKPGTSGLPANDGADDEEHLRSLEEVRGYHVRALDDDVGQIEDFLVDEDTQAIRYAVVDTRAPPPGRKVLISPHWLGDIHWNGRHVHVELSRRQIETSPEYKSGQEIDREYEERLHAHIGEPPYWG
jgi:PRC-barrel domain